MTQQPWSTQTNQGVCWAWDPSLTKNDQLIQGFVGRTGGVSQGPYESLNISYSTEDKIENIFANRRILADALGFSLESWTGIRQVHGKQVIKVGKAEAGCGVLDPDVLRVRADGLITNVPGVTLVTQHADCVPLFFWDPVQRAIGLSHAGWHGTVANIAGETVQAMISSFGTKPENLLAGIGPSAGPCHYEVDEPVISRFEDLFGQEVIHIEQILKPSQNPGRAMLNLWQANYYLLREQGLPEQNISIAGMCTICQTDRFFSHRRRDKGRQAAVLQIKE